ncbi:MAG: PQQ-binding-like beta-propeller repeat protein [Opitutales bacterium]
MNFVRVENTVFKGCAYLSLFVSLLSLQAQEGQPLNYWAIEDAAERATLPKYKTIAASPSADLTPTDGLPPREDYRNWPRSHGDYTSSKYSGLTQISRANVHQLEVAWIYRSGDKPGNVQVNPIIVDGIMYAPTSGNHVVAVNGATGKEIWRYAPKGKTSRRGITYWRGPNRERDRVLFTAGTEIIALLAISGKLDPDFGNDGIIQIPDTCAAPLAVYGNTVIFPGFSKDVYGYDMTSGKQLWVFHTLPQSGEFGYETWDKMDLGANAWSGLTMDRGRGIAYVTTGSPKPNFMGQRHRGRNLFANCLIAIDVKTGQRLWHFQEVRHDIWDMDIPGPPFLATIERDGALVDVVGAVSKMANTLLLDRVTGQPIFPFKLKRAPASKLPGFVTWPYQPKPDLPEPFATQEFSMERVTDIGEENRNSVLKKLEGATMGWLVPNALNKPNVINNVNGGGEWSGVAVDPNTQTMFVNANNFPWYITLTQAPEDFVDESKLPETPGRKVYQSQCIICHGPNREGTGEFPPLIGLKHRSTEEAVTELLKTGRNLMPAAPHIQGQDLQNLLDYVFEKDRPETSGQTKSAPERPVYKFLGFKRLNDHEGYHGSKPPWGTLNALDLNTGKLKWQVPLGEYAELTKRGIEKTGTENYGGPVATASGLVFCSGTRDLKIRAFDASTGEELWEHELPFNASAAPSIYEANGEQYIVVPATGGGKLRLPMGDAYVAFKLP